MSINTKFDTITVNGVEYDVKRRTNQRSGDEILTIWLDGEPVFESIEGTLGYETEGGGLFDPRQDCNVGVMSVSYRGYDLGEEDISKVDFQVTCPVCDGSGELTVYTLDGDLIEDPATLGMESEAGPFTVRLPDCHWCNGDGTLDISPFDYFKQERGARVVLPLIVYEHSGITMQVGHVGQVVGDAAGWDTSFVGFIFDTPETIKECFGDNVTDEQIEKALRQEVETYASYLEGDITQYMVEDEETNYHDSCGGYVGMHKECETECFEALKQAVTRRVAEEAERAYWLDRGVVTV
jgi:hypothetical protein